MLPLGVLFLLPLLHSGFSHDCQPGFANICFLLHLQYNLKEMVAKNVTTEAVHDLCLAIENSLNCTEAIVDWDCSQTVRKVRVNSWLKALRGIYSYVCQGKEHTPLKNSRNTANIQTGFHHSPWQQRDYQMSFQSNQRNRHPPDSCTIQAERNTVCPCQTSLFLHLGSIGMESPRDN